MFVHVGNGEPNWQEYTLILPAVSVGNVGQLAADLIISSLWMDRIGYFYDDSLLPVAGNDPFYTGNPSTMCKLVTSCEMYEATDAKVMVIQQRAPFVKGKRKQFRQKLIDWIKEKQFEHVIVLASSYAHERLDKQMIGSQLRYFVTPKLDQQVGSFLKENLKWLELEKRQAFPAPASPRLNNVTEDGSLYIPGGGITKSFFEQCCEEDITAAVVLVFCSEGDNAPEAITLATYLNEWLNLVDLEHLAKQGNPQLSTGWRIPNSWRLNYGSTFDKTIF